MLLGGCGCQNRAYAIEGLKTIAIAQADFHSHDRDHDRAQNYWVRDVYGLFALCPRGDPAAPDSMIKLIEPSLAGADATAPAPWDNEVDVERAIGTFSPKSGYRYVMMTHDAQGRPYDDGSGRNPHVYAVCAFPVQIRRSAQQTYIMNESRTIWAKRTDGVVVLRWPANPEAEGWRRLD